MRLKVFALKGDHRLTQKYGTRVEFYKKCCNCERGHDGLDYSCAIGTPVYAMHDGRIQNKDQPEGFGLVTNVVADEGGMTTYAHLSNQLKSDHERVLAGDLIGMSGNTGISSGPHLHIGLRLKGFHMNDGMFGYVDPLPYILDIPSADENSLLQRVEALELTIAELKEFLRNW